MSGGLYLSDKTSYYLITGGEDPAAERMTLMPHSSYYIQGQQAKRDGATYNDNPYVIGKTKLGAIKLSAEGEEWAAGLASVGRIASPAEVQAALEQTDISRFRRKPNRYYR